MKKQSGFLLVGLLVTVAVILLLAGGWLFSQKENPLFDYFNRSSVEVGEQLEKLPPEFDLNAQKCQKDNDCMATLGVCNKDDCPSWRCFKGRCVLIKDAQRLESCLKEAKEARTETCEEMGLSLDNCVGIDFVEDPVEACYRQQIE